LICRTDMSNEAAAVLKSTASTEHRDSYECLHNQRVRHLRIRLNGYPFEGIIIHELVHQIA